MLGLQPVWQEKVLFGSTCLVCSQFDWSLLAALAFIIWAVHAVLLDCFKTSRTFQWCLSRWWSSCCLNPRIELHGLGASYKLMLSTAQSTQTSEVFLGCIERCACSAAAYKFTNHPCQRVSRRRCVWPHWLEAPEVFSFWRLYEHSKQDGEHRYVKWKDMQQIQKQINWRIVLEGVIRGYKRVCPLRTSS